MEAWRNELYHHGILGMKWGVRRYQNYDGTLTAAGRKRYANNREKVFSEAEKKVISKLSNEPKDFKELDINIHTVRKRGNLTQKEAVECCKIAKELYSKAKAVEPTITNDVTSTAKATGNTMYGLEFRLKQPTSLAAKIGSDAKEDGVSFKKSAANIKDSVRYTTVSSDKDFVKNYNNMKKELEKKGYKEDACKNYFEMYNKGLVKHKSVQSTFSNKDGFKFEIQFQTTSSQAAKELKIPIYEKRRQSGLSEAQKRDIERQMEDLAIQVKDPYDIDKIRSHK